MRNVAQQGQAELLFDGCRQMENMIEAIAQQTRSNSSGDGQQTSLQQALAQRWLDRCGIHAWWGDQPPGHRALGNLQLEGFPGADQTGQVVLGDGEATLEVVVLLDQFRLLQELVVQHLALLSGAAESLSIEIEG